MTALTVGHNCILVNLYIYQGLKYPLLSVKSTLGMEAFKYTPSDLRNGRKSNVTSKPCMKTYWDSVRGKISPQKPAVLVKIPAFKQAQEGIQEETLVFNILFWVTFLPCVTTLESVVN